MQRRPLPKDRDQLVRVHGGDLPHVEVTAQTLLQLERAAERLLHLDLLVQHKTDQERQRIGLEEAVRLRVVGPDNRHSETLVAQSGEEDGTC